MTMKKHLGSVCATALAALLVIVTMASAIAATSCKNTGDFKSWLSAFKAEAQKEGISPNTLAATAPLLTFDQGIINRDRAQGVFQQPFTQFAGRMVSADRLARGRKLMAKHADLFAQIDKDTGVPASVITAYWALESDFGSSMGKLPVLKSLTTLAFDCRRSAMFRPELKAALSIVQAGDLTPSQMIGSWAGELGQTQFLPSFYLAHAVDRDGDGRRDLLTSVPDLLASTGAYIQALGWQRGQPWLQEVRVPAEMDWSKADLAIRLPRQAWAKAGVTQPDGKPLAPDALPAALILPMGRTGPAFLAYANFDVYLKWNASFIYSTSAAYMATRMAGAPPLSRTKVAVKPLTMAEIKELQSLLARNGLPIGEIDGKLGAGTRSAVKAMQTKLGLPADSYPTADLLARLR
jgi:lytic murein transglycosylase